MRYLTAGEVLELHRRLVAKHGGKAWLLDFAGLESAVAQPRQGFGGKDLYPSLEAKAAALCFSLVRNHPFSDGNKRVGHAAAETFLVLNGYELIASVDEAEQIVLGVAGGHLSRESLQEWIRLKMVKL
jgi:death-on-curing protein